MNIGTLVNNLLDSVFPDYVGDVVGAILDGVSGNYAGAVTNALDAAADVLEAAGADDAAAALEGALDLVSVVC